MTCAFLKFYYLLTNTQKKTGGGLLVLLILSVTTHQKTKKLLFSFTNWIWYLKNILAEDDRLLASWFWPRWNTAKLFITSLLSLLSVSSQDPLTSQKVPLVLILSLMGEECYKQTDHCLKNESLYK